MNDIAFLELLKKSNNGILRGAKTNLAKKLQVNETLITHILKGRQKPSERIIKKMANILSTTEENLKKIFDFSENNNIKNIIAINENKNLKKELELAKERIIFLEEQVLFYKNNKKTK
ncbi:MAG: hypothetical protein AB7E39_06800 [Endomicrobiaceae bacterium]